MKYLSGLLTEKGYTPKALRDIPIGPACLIVSPAEKPDALLGYINSLAPGSILIGGQMAEQIFERAHECGVKYINLAADEAFSVHNAVPTAEGALELILANTPRIIRGQRIAIVGFGRIGKLLANMLFLLGAKVHVAARNPVSRAWALGLSVSSVNGMADQFRRCSVLINTVPAQIIGRPVLEALAENSLIIELSSPPYGFDSQLAEELGHRVILAPGLPAKAAPYSAAQFMLEAIIRLAPDGLS